MRSGYSPVIEIDGEVEVAYVAILYVSESLTNASSFFVLQLLLKLYKDEKAV